MSLQKCKHWILSLFVLALCAILPLALSGCGSGGESGITPLDYLSDTTGRPIYDTTYYLPAPACSLVYSNGESVYEAKYLGQFAAAGMMASKFGTAAIYNLYGSGTDGIYLCGSESQVFGVPVKLCKNKVQLYDECTSCVTINGKATLISSMFMGGEAITTGAGMFNTLKFEMIFSDAQTGGVNYIRTINLAQNIGIIADKVTNQGQTSVTTLIAGTTETAVYTKPKKEWAILIYSCGHNFSSDLSPHLYNQIKQFDGTGIGANAHVIAQIAPTNAVLGGKTTRFSLENDRMTAVKTIIDRTVDTGATSEITGFYNWAIDAYPANHYALFISGHGSGAISVLYSDGSGGPAVRSIAYDDAAKNSLKLYGLSETFGSVTSKIGKKADIIVFDSCVMQMLEVAYQIKDYADYFVASQAAMAGEGIDMIEFAKKFNASADRSSLNVSKMLVDACIDSPRITIANLTMSVTRLSMCDQIKTLVDSFADGIGEIKSDTDAVAFLMAVYGAQRFGPLDSNNYSSCYIDLFDFAIKLNNFIDAGAAKTAAQALINVETSKSFIVYNRRKGEYFKAADGISIFMPKQSGDWINSNYTREQYRHFTNFGRDGKWYDFLDEWSKILSANGM